MNLTTPYFLISAEKLQQNLNKIQWLRQNSGVKIVLALKCFSTWGIFKLMQPYLDGTTSSSVYEAKLGYETFGGETHAYSVGFSPADIEEVNQFADKLIFNSLSQYHAYREILRPDLEIGLRINPEISYAKQDLANPARQYSRLGVKKADLDPALFKGIQGAMFHMNCENSNLDEFVKILDHISTNFSEYLDRLKWVSLGGGILFTADQYPLADLAQVLKDFSQKHQIQVYLEPGEAVITKTTDLVVTIVDIIKNEKYTAIVDSATEAHRLDTLIYNEPATIKEANPRGEYEYIIGSSSCLAGDIFCTARFDQPLKVGDRLHICDSAGYTMVKLNWFNGLRMPSIYLEHLNGDLELINQYNYQDFKDMLSRP